MIHDDGTRGGRESSRPARIERNGLTEFRSFRNIDPPALAELWCHHPPLRALMQPMSVDVFERVVLSKPYFDRDGLIVATRDGRILGFAHAGFGCDSQGGLSFERGATCMLMVAPPERTGTLGRDLLQRSEEYLRRAGAQRLSAGPVFPADAFYLGLYGGSELPGVLASDTWLLELYAGAAYREIGRRVILQRELAGFRAPMDRHLMQIRRSLHVEAEVDPAPRSWWEACTFGQTDRSRYHLKQRRGQDTVGSVTYWDLEPLASSWGVHAAGLWQWELHDADSRPGIELFLLAESIRQLQADGVTLVEVQVPAEDSARLQLFERLGFQQVDEGIILEKA